MSLVVQNDIIVAAFLAAWVDNAGQLLTPYSLDDVAFVAPTDQPWARLTVRFGREDQMSMGQIGENQVLWRNVQAIIGQIFTPTQLPQSIGLSLCETFAAIYRGRQFVIDTTDIVCWAASTQYVGRDPAGYNQFNVSIQAYANELR